ncbi:2501_t:CDS:2 [Paraglomus occultum]|uniref:2501_t:CDS:1 n=1 Tax=Paraglomus occultum TaxID=144539 RepID=A0A9N8ZBL5_9GLOM|nr:2501_t:CDS:2 [Paraglomus occultum]
MTSPEQRGNIVIYDSFNTCMDIDLRNITEDGVAMSNLPVDFTVVASTQKTGQSSRPLLIAAKSSDTDNTIKQNENSVIHVSLQGKSGVDQKMSLEERRRQRNKISARNFRARRKEYVQRLETTVQEQQNEILRLNQLLAYFKETNTKLTQEVEQLRLYH